MGALTRNRKRGEDYYKSSALISPHSDYVRISKRPKFLGAMSQNTPDFWRTVSSNTMASRVSQYPDSKPQISREVHAPVRNHPFGFLRRVNKAEISSSSKESSADKMGRLLGKYETTKNIAMKSLKYFGKEAEVSVGKENKKQVIEIHVEEENQVVVSDDSSIEEVEIVEKEWRSLSSSVVTDVSNVNTKVDSTEKTMDLTQLKKQLDAIEAPVHRKLYDSAMKRNHKLDNLAVEIEFNEKRLQRFHLLQSQKEAREATKDVSKECFVPLSKEEDVEVTRALSKSYGNRRKVLVSHKNSNIDITGEKLQCLSPGAWLNDEVINLYLELLKEREKRDPQKFLKSHFFNTFFYKKLTAGKGGYNFQSVRRWTTQRKLGYGLLECDKIFVPIHKEIHWCLAIINKKEEKFQYLDSLRGGDAQVMKVLSRYFVDEVKDKSGKDIDVSSWEHEFVEDLPGQGNGFDCGMFMLKYADFNSRDIGLCFSQKDMPYFRRRTAKEILRLRAD